jgi:hypothetical protein
MKETKYPSDDTCCGINIWSPFWPCLSCACAVVQFVALLVMIYCAALAEQASR